MILQTPIQSDEIEQNRSKTIRDVYADYQETFVILHPFIKVKEGHNVRFDTWKRPTKNEIYLETLPVKWSDIVLQANLRGINELDGLLAYLHCGRMKADKDAWLKFMRYIDKAKLIVPEVDDYPLVLINPTLEALKSLGYMDVLIYSDISDKKVEHKISDLLHSGDKLPESNSRVLTKDNKILLATDADKRFSYISSDKKTLEEIIDMIDLEGFYCNATTVPEWSYQPLKGCTIDWSSPERKDYK